MALLQSLVAVSVGAADSLQLVGVSGADLDVLALVAAAPDFHKSSPMPSMRPTSWGSARNRRARTAREAVEMALGSPAGTTEAQVDDMMMVLEVADEATPAPIRPRPEWVKISIPLI